MAVGRASYLSKGASGQIAVMFALAMLAVVPMMALIFDGGNIYVQRRTAQNAADAGAMAGLRALQHVPPPSVVPLVADPTVFPGETTVAEAICQFVTANSFGSPPAATANFVDNAATPVLTPITLSTDAAGKLQCGKPLASQPKNIIPMNTATHISVTAITVDVTIGPFPTILAGFLGKGIASGQGAGIAQATTTAHAGAQGEGLRQTPGKNAPFFICGVNTVTAPGDPDGPNYPILQMTGANPELPGGTPISPAQFNPRAYGKTFIIHGAVDQCGDNPGIWHGLSNMFANAGVGSLDLEATPRYLWSSPTTAAQNTSNSVDVSNGCDITVANWTSCIMEIPITTRTKLPVPSNQKWCVAWAAFLITTQSSTEHWATLLHDDGFPPFTPNAITWTWYDSVTLPFLSTSTRLTQ